MSEITTVSGCILAAFRNLAGPGILLAVGAVHLVEHPPIASFLDLLFLAVAGANVVAGMLYTPPAPPPQIQSGEVRGMSQAVYLGVILGVTVLVWLLSHFVLGPGR